MDELRDTSGAAADYRRVDLHVPAEADQLFLVRMVAEGAALAADFPLDFAADAKLAADQAASSLVERATAGTALRCRFRSCPDHIQMSLSVESEADPTTLREGLGFRMLAALADSVSITAQPYVPLERQTTAIEFVLRSAVTPPS